MSTLTIATAAINIVLGLVYISYGLITIADLRAYRATRGSSHFGFAWIAMAFTCGPHHFEHGLHLATGGSPAGALDLAVVAFGFPAGVTWFLLRVEALRGGRGDRTLDSDLLVDVIRTIMAVAVVLLVAALASLQVPPPGWSSQALSWRLTPNILLVALYTALGLVLLRTQVRRHRVTDTWSLSGLALTAVFPTCAAMHAVWVGYVASGLYEPDLHLLVTDVLAVPAAVYFLGVTWMIAEGWLPDWAEAAGDVKRPPSSEDAELEALLH